jgi:sugar phosphate isomerase/epimerase
MRCAITVSLVPEVRGGPFVFWDGLEDAFKKAAALGFDGVEIFPNGPEGLDVNLVRRQMDASGLSVAAVGTGAGWVVGKMHLCHPDASVRDGARAFIRGTILKAAELGAPTILGSMQGRVESGVERHQALDWLAEALREFGEMASECGQVFLYEPLNRYETNLFNRQGDGAGFLRNRGLTGVSILADLFHMGIEESDSASALAGIADVLGHVHFADSNRQAAGAGQTRFEPIFRQLKAQGYAGYLSAEVFPMPDSLTAARLTIDRFRQLISNH